MKSLLSIPDDAVITVLTAHNPRRQGSKIRERYDVVWQFNGRTVGEYLAAGGNPRTLRNAWVGGYVSLQGVGVALPEEYRLRQELVAALAYSGKERQTAAKELGVSRITFGRWYRGGVITEKYHRRLRDWIEANRYRKAADADAAPVADGPRIEVRDVVASAKTVTITVSISVA